MDKSEYWILDSVVRYKSPIDILDGSEDAIVCWFGWPGPDLTRPELVDVFYRLFQLGYLVATRTDKDRNLWFECFVPTKDEIEVGLSQELYFDYGLTAKGGTLWEKETHADWSRFFEIALLGEQTIRLSGSDRNLIESALEDSAEPQGFSMVMPRACYGLL